MNEKIITRLKKGEINDYVLNGNSIWIDVENLTLYIHKTDEGVVVDIYPKKTDLLDSEIIASTYAFFNEGSVK